MFLLLPDRAVLGILLAGDKQGMCPLIFSAGIVPALENSEPVFVDDKKEGAAVVTEVSVLSHGRVEDGEVWTSLKRNI